MPLPMSWAVRISSVSVSNPSERAAVRTSLLSCAAAEYLGLNMITKRRGPGTSSRRKASHVATRARQACNKSGANRVRRYCKDDRDRGRRLLGSGNRATCCQDDIHLQANKLGRQVGEAPAVPLGPTIFEGERASITPAEFIQALGKYGK